MKFRTSQVLALIALTSSGAVSQAQLRVIRAFDERTEGRIASTVVVDSTIYGITDSNTNNLFAVSLDSPQFEITGLPIQPGRGFQVPPDPGPLATLDGLVVGAFTPPINDVFTVDFDGTNFRTIVNAEEIGENISNPIVVGARVYGATERGVFSTNADGTDLGFVQGEIETPPYAQLSSDGERIYGATIESFSGVSDAAKLFSINPDGSDYRTIAKLDFNTSSIDVMGDTVYGAYSNKLFSIDTDGTDFAILNEFPSGIGIDQVLVEGDQLFGVINGSGSVPYGILFRSNLDGSNLETIHEFGPGPNNGNYPNRDLVVIGSNLYGSTFEGGFEVSEAHPLGGGGILYTLPTNANAVPEPCAICIWLGLGAVVAFRCCRQRICSTIFGP